MEGKRFLEGNRMLVANYNLYLPILSDFKVFEKLRTNKFLIEISSSDIPLNGICTFDENNFDIQLLLFSHIDDYTINQYSRNIQDILAAKKSGVKRVIYASSIHAISVYPKDAQVKTTDPVNPGNLYGVSKCFGEALGRYMGEQEGLSTIAIRTGRYLPYSFFKDEPSIAYMNSWLSQPDALQLFEKCIDAPLDLKFAITHGLSHNILNRMDINSTNE